MASRQRDDDCARMLRALADETRLAVVRLLLTGPKYVAELNRQLKLEPTLLSHHLRVLREMGLVTARREGKTIRYGLARGMHARLRGDAVDLGCCCLKFFPPHTTRKAAMAMSKTGRKRPSPSRPESEYPRRRRK